MLWGLRWGSHPRSQRRDRGHPRLFCLSFGIGHFLARQRTRLIGGLRNCFKLHAAGGVHEDEDDIAGFDGFVDFLQHAAVELGAGLVDAGGIDKDDLRGGIRVLVRGDFDHAQDAIARGLRLGGDDGYLFAGEGVEEGAFADVGPAENGDES